MNKKKKCKTLKEKWKIFCFFYLSFLDVGLFFIILMIIIDCGDYYYYYY